MCKKKGEGLRCYPHAKKDWAVAKESHMQNPTAETLSTLITAQLNLDATLTVRTKMLSKIEELSVGGKVSNGLIDRYKSACQHHAARIATGDEEPVEADELEEKQETASDPTAPASVLCSLAQDPDLEVRRRLLYNPRIPAEALVLLCQDKDWKIRQAAATHAEAPAAQLSRMARDPNSTVRIRVATHLNTPVDALSRLAKDRDSNVARAVFENPNTPTEAREVAAKGCDALQLV